jgi:hypothetical protein
MRTTLADLWKTRKPGSVVKSPREAIILASIVEKETGVPSERRTVAAVYTNRLKQGMMLQADPTIIYPITKGKPLGRRIRKSEIAAVNGYNTYAMTGLPEGQSPPCSIRRRAGRSTSWRTARAAMSLRTRSPSIMPMSANGMTSAARAARCRAISP